MGRALGLDLVFTCHESDIVALVLKELLLLALKLSQPLACGIGLRKLVSQTLNRAILSMPEEAKEPDNRKV